MSGYMFGKGIYLADTSSKSANYCCSYSSGGTALLLLCEAELGNPMHKLTYSSYTAGEDAKANGMYSTWGQGSTGPSKWKDAKCVNEKLAGCTMVRNCILSFASQLLTHISARRVCQARTHEHLRRVFDVQRVHHVRCLSSPPTISFPRPDVGRMPVS